MNFNFLNFAKTSMYFALLFLFFSCASKKDIVYYQNIDGISASQNATSYEVKIQPDDLLMIIVSAEDPEITIPFNLMTIAVSNTGKPDLATGQLTTQTYLVDRSGNIEFPVLGKLQVGGLTRTEVLQKLKSKIEVYIKNPIINLRITNFKISLHGEVALPGTYPITSERVTLIEALSMAKDLTIYGRRNNILVIREINGVKSYNRVDITKADFINSPFYYLAQNDVVYVEPNNTKVNAAAVGPNTSVIVSAISILVSLSVLLFK
ncbi:polysaccharide biosynthesis/export family protein [Flavobacterium pectinovorum]|uniref:polysaccharide biosynthesis/export family protein n=1 Tax=Flavobacterium pectinovorum TaxID=29533 RepID=UPI001FABC108|nr:polysaccharide biosynthesis/export family protein [Flavobacterium pectinovorum]MCI9846272.1 polysaccharide biosynthesis/export family protein [Flavobacterium pectinovorum]